MGAWEPISITQQYNNNVMLLLFLAIFLILSQIYELNALALNNGLEKRTLVWSFVAIIPR
jgi:hypothetical protein